MFVNSNIFIGGGDLIENINIASKNVACCIKRPASTNDTQRKYFLTKRNKIDNKALISSNSVIMLYLVIIK